MDLVQAEGALLLGDTQALVDALSAMIAADDHRAAAQLRRAEVRMVRQEVEAAIEDVLEGGRALADDPERAVVAEVLAARLLNRTLRREAAQTLLDHAAPRVDASDERAVVMLAMTQAEIHLDRQQLAPARAGFEAILPRLVGDRWAHEAAQAWLCLAAIAQLEARIPDAALALVEVLKLAQRFDDARLGAEPRFTLGALHLRIQDWSVAKDLLGPATTDPWLPPRFRALAHTLLARVALVESRWDDAIKGALLGARLAAGLNDPHGYTDGSVVVSTAQARAGRREDAGRTCDAAERTLRERGQGQLADLIALHRYELLGAAKP